MLRDAIRTAITNKPLHGDDRAAGRGSAHPSAADLEQKPPILRRTTIDLLAIFITVVILYGALMPFQVDQGKSLDWTLGWKLPRGGDAVANVLIYIPIGAFLRLVFRHRGSRPVLEWFYSLVTIFSLSYLTEVGQSVLVNRYPGWTDVVCNMTGSVIGIACSPRLQRSLRNFHAWLYHELRVRPLATAATAAMICLCTYALSPFDVHPTPNHVQTSWNQLRSVSVEQLWSPGSDNSLSSTAILDKIVSAGAYGLLAFLLMLAGKEVGRSARSAAWYAITRSSALVVAVEGVQFFTISHVADLRDVATAVLFCGAGTCFAWLLTVRAADLQRVRIGILQGVIATVAGVLLAWAVGSVMLSHRAQGVGDFSWWPAFGSFHRTWDSLLGDYTTGLLQYVMVSGLIILWHRATDRVPVPAIVLVLTVTAAVASVAVATFRNYSADTTHVILAVLACLIALKVDRAIFGKRLAPATEAAR